MEDKLLFRRARPDEADALGEMALQGITYWGHDKKFPELVESLIQNEMPTSDYIHESPVYVLEEAEKCIGFYGLEDREEFVDLRYMFLDIDYIGQGYGKKLWQHAVKEAPKLGHERMRILSDPKALGFYSAMGAKQIDEHVIKPGFALGIFWFDLKTD